MYEILGLIGIILLGMLLARGARCIGAKINYTEKITKTLKQIKSEGTNK